jgi:hypothetical protein
MKECVGVLALALFGAAAMAQDTDLRPPREIKHSAVTFHLVAGEAQRGYDAVATSSGETVYVARKPAFTGRDLNAARLVGVEDGANVIATLNDGAAKRFRSLERRGSADRLAVKLNGELLSTASVESFQSDGSVTLAGFGTREANRLMVPLQRELSAVEEGVTLVPDQQTGRAGDTIVVKVYVKDIHDVRGYQVTLDITGGERGQLVVDDIFIDEGSTEYLFEGTQGFNAVNTDRRLIVNALPAGAVDRAGRAYLGTYVLKASPDARGDFEVTVLGGEDTLFLGPTSNRIDVGRLGSTTISIR